MTDKPINKRRHWCREDCLLLLELDSAKPRPTHQALADRFGGITAHAIAMKLVKLRRGESLPKPRAAPKPKPAHSIPHMTKMLMRSGVPCWLPTQDEAVLKGCRIRDPDSYRTVAAQIGRSQHAVRQRFYTLRRAAMDPPENPPTVKTVRTAADRRAQEARTEPLRYASPFGELLGEPPIGRRAIDKKFGTAAP